MLRLFFANSSSYTQLVCIVSLLQRKANWQEKKGLFLASFPHLHSRRQSCFKPTNYPQFITVMTRVKDKAKISFWTGLTSNEGDFCQRDCTQTYKSPVVFRECLHPFFCCLKGLPFCPVSCSHPCTAYLSDACTILSAAVGAALPPSHRAGTLPTTTVMGQQTLNSSCSSSPPHSSTWQSITSFLPVLVSAGTEVIFFLVAGVVPCFGFGMKNMLITYRCF